VNRQIETALEWIDVEPYPTEGIAKSDLCALAKAFRTLHDTVKRYANEDAWTGQFSKDGRQDLWLYGEGKATAVKALKELE